MTLPVSVEDDLEDIKLDSCVESFKNPGEIAAESVFNFFPAEDTREVSAAK